MRADSRLVRDITPSPNFGDRRGRTIDALILHYTGMSTGEAAHARLVDPSSEVSCHYLVCEDGCIAQLVAEADRAWHAGRSSWAGETDMNGVSIGIEIVNAGHDGGCPPYTEAQIETLIPLCRDICGRHAIAPSRVLGHSDIAPDRKCDPGEYFPWQRLAAAGVGLDVPAQTFDAIESLGLGAAGPDVLALQEGLQAFGYACATTGSFGVATERVVVAFQRHFRPRRVDGVADGETRAVLQALL